MVYALDENGRFTLVTEQFAETLGYERSEMVGEPASLVLDDEGIRRGREVLVDLLKSDRDSAQFEAVGVGPDGERFPAEIEVGVLTDDDGNFEGSVGVVRDVTDLERARERAERERSRFTYLFDNLPDPVVEVELVEGEPIVRQVNPAFESVFGYEAGSIVEENLNDYILPEDLQREGRRLDEKIAREGSDTREVRRLTADGERYFLYRGVAYDDEDDVGFAIYTDVTDRKRREQYLRVVGRVLRHNLRNDVGTISGYAELLAEELSGDSLAEYARAIVETAKEVTDISEDARDLQSVVTDPDDERRRVDLARVGRRVAGRYDEAYPAATVSTALPESLPVSAGDHLETAVEHLVENAIEHGGEAPRVELLGRREGDTAELRVVDDGSGIPEHELAAITGEREATQLEHASGLGLWFVRLVADKYDGALSFGESRFGGAEVRVAFDATDHGDDP